MDLPDDVRDQFRRYRGMGGRRRAEAMVPAARRTVARRAAAARWIRQRFGASSFEVLGLPGGEMVDAGLADLAAERVTLESLAVSIAAPRLRREGVPIGPGLDDPEGRLFDLLRGCLPSRSHRSRRVLRRDLTRESLRALMSELARTAPRGGSYRVYLVGGGTAVLAGWRPATIDADLHADDDEVFRDIQGIKERLRLNLRRTPVTQT